MPVPWRRSPRTRSPSPTTSTRPSTEAFTYDGTWYCPPKDFSTLGLVYNVDMLEAAGVEPPTNMEELAAAAEALTADGVVGLSFGPELDRVGVFMLANGGYIVNDDVSEMTLDTEENRAALQYLADMFAAGHAGRSRRPSKPGGQARPSGRARRRWLSRATGSSARWPTTSRTSTGPSPSFRKDQLARRRMPSRCATRVATESREPGGFLGGDRLSHRSRGGCGVDGGVQRDARPRVAARRLARRPSRARAVPQRCRVRPRLAVPARVHRRRHRVQLAVRAAHRR